MRKLATIRRIDEIRPIEGADTIEAAVVGGWVVVVKRDEFTVGDLAVYLEIDSWVPTELAPFLSKGGEPREFNGVKGERLRSIKLRGVVSQGLLLPMNVIPQAHGVTYYPPDAYQEGTDVTDELKIQKWEAPIPAQLAGDVVGAFPSFVPKTDQERIQNLTEEFVEWQAQRLQWEITEKLDGSSMTVFHKDGHTGVCSRNWELKESESNSMWACARRYGLQEILEREGNYAVQGEIVGEGIQGNPYKLRGQDYFVYDVYSINESRYLSPAERRAFVERNGLKHVPLVAVSAQLYDTLGIQTVEHVLKFAEGRSALHSGAEREGLVFKHNGTQSFKSISNRFLLRGGE